MNTSIENLNLANADLSAWMSWMRQRCFSAEASSIDGPAQILSPPSGIAHNATLADQHQLGCSIQWRRLDTTLMTSATITAP
jgi:hypothetical protein